MSSRVAQVKLALVGYEPGDRVVVFQDTGSFLEMESLPRSGVVVHPLAGHERDRPNCFCVLMDRHPFTNGTVNGWWVLPQDMRLE